MSGLRVTCPESALYAFDYFNALLISKGPVRPSAKGSDKHGQVLLRMFDSDNRRAWQPGAPGLWIGFGREEHEMWKPAPHTVT
jgi:hypothetical protein